MKTFKWSEKQKKALLGSIRKWQRISNGLDTDKGVNSCPCCKLWNTDDNDCKGCPISAFTKQTFCDGSPYEIWERDEYYMTNDPKEIPVEGIEIATSELNFLRALYLAGGGK